MSDLEPLDANALQHESSDPFPGASMSTASPPASSRATDSARSYSTNSSPRTLSATSRAPSMPTFLPNGGPAMNGSQNSGLNASGSIATSSGSPHLDRDRPNIPLAPSVSQRSPPPTSISSSQSTSLRSPNPGAGPVAPYTLPGGRTQDASDLQRPGTMVRSPTSGRPPVVPAVSIPQHHSTASVFHRSDSRNAEAGPALQAAAASKEGADGGEACQPRLAAGERKSVVYRSALTWTSLESMIQCGAMVGVGLALRRHPTGARYAWEGVTVVAALGCIWRIATSAALVRRLKTRVALLDHTGISSSDDDGEDVVEVTEAFSPLRQSRRVSQSEALKASEKSVSEEGAHTVTTEGDSSSNGSEEDEETASSASSSDIGGAASPVLHTPRSSEDEAQEHPLDIVNQRNMSLCTSAFKSDSENSATRAKRVKRRKKSLKKRDAKKEEKKKQQQSAHAEASGQSNVREKPRTGSYSGTSADLESNPSFTHGLIKMFTTTPSTNASISPGSRTIDASHSQTRLVSHVSLNGSIEKEPANLHRQHSDHHSPFDTRVPDDASTTSSSEDDLLLHGLPSDPRERKTVLRTARDHRAARLEARRRRPVSLLGWVRRGFEALGSLAPMPREMDDALAEWDEAALKVKEAAAFLPCAIASPPSGLGDSSNGGSLYRRGSFRSNSFNFAEFQPLRHIPSVHSIAPKSSAPQSALASPRGMNRSVTVFPPEGENIRKRRLSAAARQLISAGSNSAPSPFSAEASARVSSIHAQIKQAGETAAQEITSADVAPSNPASRVASPVPSTFSQQFRTSGGSVWDSSSPKTTGLSQRTASGPGAGGVSGSPHEMDVDESTSFGANPLSGNRSRQSPAPLTLPDAEVPSNANSFSKMVDFLPGDKSPMGRSFAPHQTSPKASASPRGHSGSPRAGVSSPQVSYLVPALGGGGSLSSTMRHHRHHRGTFRPTSWGGADGDTVPSERTGTVLVLSFKSLLGDGPVPNQRTVEILSNALGRALSIFEEYDGVIHQFSLDEVVVTFNVQRPCPEHTKLAVFAAIAVAQGLSIDPDLDIPWAVGLAQGPVVAGDAGTARQRTFVICGATVAIAKDLALLNYTLGSRILMTEAIHDEVQSQVVALLVDFVSDVHTDAGSCQLFPVFELRGDAEKSMSMAGASLRSDFSERPYDGVLPHEMEVAYLESFYLFRMGRFQDASSRFDDVDDFYVNNDSQLNRFARLLQYFLDRPDQATIPYYRRLQPQWEQLEAEASIAILNTSKPSPSLRSGVRRASRIAQMHDSPTRIIEAIQRAHSVRSESMVNASSSTPVDQITSPAIRPHRQPSECLPPLASPQPHEGSPKIDHGRIEAFKFPVDGSSAATSSHQTPATEELAHGRQSVGSVSFAEGSTTPLELSMRRPTQLNEADLSPREGRDSADLGSPHLSHKLANQQHQVFRPHMFEPVDDESGAVEFTDVNDVRWRRSEKQLGKGAFGQVYLGMRVDDGKLCAMKQLHIPNVDAAGEASSPNPRIRHRRKKVEESLNQLVSEVRLLCKLNHPNIVFFLGCGVVDTDILINMEYVSGGSLQTVLDQFGKLPVSAAQRYLKDVLRGLRYLHENDIVHRDMKPANVLLHVDGSCKVTDFGTSIQLHKLLDNNIVVGTPLYMSPEQAKGAKETCFQSDIWSIGIMTVQLLTGVLPLSVPDGPFGMNKLMMDLAAGTAEISIPDSLPLSARSFVLQCLQSDPQMRGTTDELLVHPFLVMATGGGGPNSSRRSVRNSAPRGEEDTPMQRTQSITSMQFASRNTPSRSISRCEEPTSAASAPRQVGKGNFESGSLMSSVASPNRSRNNSDSTSSPLSPVRERLPLPIRRNTANREVSVEVSRRSSLSDSPTEPNVDPASGVAVNMSASGMLEKADNIPGLLDDAPPAMIQFIETESLNGTGGSEVFGRTNALAGTLPPDLRSPKGARGSNIEGADDSQPIFELPPSTALPHNNGGAPRYLRRRSSGAPEGSSMSLSPRLATVAISEPSIGSRRESFDDMEDVAAGSTNTAHSQLSSRSRHLSTSHLSTTSHNSSAAAEVTNTGTPLMEPEQVS